MATKEQENNENDYSTMDFQCDYTDNLPAILHELNISLAFTSYQAGRLMIVRSDGKTLDVNYKSFPRPMGLTATEDGLTLGTFTEIINFHREDGLLEKIKQPLQKIEQDITAPRIKAKGADESDETNSEPEVISELSESQRAEQEAEKKEFNDYQESLFAPVDQRADACFITRSSHYSGMINVHDIDWGDEGLWVVNSSFSCLCTLDPDFSFVPRWKPHFISELVPEDRCHLNGMTLKDGKPAYVTTFSKYDEVGMWRKGDKFDGTLMDVHANKVVVDGLSMPHSPRWYQDRVYFCNSGHGEVCSYEPNSGDKEIIAQLPGFTRGMDFYGPLMFVGLSKVRQGDVKNPAPLEQKYPQTFSGIWLINRAQKTDNEVGYIKFSGNVDQIYDVAVLPNCSFPELIEPNHPRMRNHFSHPQLEPIA